MNWTFDIADAVLLTGLFVLLGLLFLQIRASREQGRRLDELSRLLLEQAVRPEITPADHAPPDRPASPPSGAEPEQHARAQEVTLLSSDLVSKLTVAVSVLVHHLEIAEKTNPGADREMIESIRQACLAIVENTWLRDMHDAYDASIRQRESLYQQSASVTELREKIAGEDARLRRELEAIGHRLEEMLDATQGRYAKASIRLTEAMERALP